MSAAITALIGKYVLVGITTIAADGSVVDQSQLHGTVVRAGPEIGIELTLSGGRAGETFTLPYDPDAFVPAIEGATYNLSNGETVVDPDFTSVWEVHQPGETK